LAHCDDIAPLLSAFNDGELTPHETNSVAEHLDGCEPCKASVLDYLLIGHHLRTVTTLPCLDGFTERVMEGIAATRRPFWGRLLNRMDDLRESWVAAVSLMGTAIALAALALALAEPHALQRVAGWFGGTPAPVIVENEPAAPPSPIAVSETLSETHISRLEAKPSSVATWSEPDTKTTVIWLADDTSGND